MYLSHGRTDLLQHSCPPPVIGCHLLEPSTCMQKPSLGYLSLPSNLGLEHLLHRESLFCFLFFVPNLSCEFSVKALGKSLLGDVEVFVSQHLKIKSPSIFFLPTSIAASSSSHCSAKGKPCLSPERLVNCCSSLGYLVSSVF